ncbi:BBM_1a_G0016520.mRNA.1.CDS.1 [Saccharomyces cerevisiae]|nr:BBM_1a_G0016520.mRNA.1.CDS.1 [Saccharomyces cerevisiae]CAI7106788.1 BBM_1a_G0016520.mRNA.1.CDS.1 [Saccharomyces cerevisiae]
MASNRVTKLLKALEEIRNKCQKSPYQLNVNVGLIFLGCTFDLLNVASMISLIDDLAKTYNISYTTASWSLTSYAVTFAGFIACMGRLGDIVGSSVLFTISCSLFAILSLLCAVMPNFPAFAVFRAIQGICAAGLVPCAYALIPILAPKEKVQTYFSMVSCGFSSTIGLGLIIGGAFAATKIGYRRIFYLTFAVMSLISIIAFFFTYDVERFNKKPQNDQIQTNVKSLDFIGSLIFVAGSILIVFGLTEGGESWNRPVTYVTLIIGIILFFGFFVWNCTYAKVVRGIRCVGIDTSKYFEKVQLLIPVDVLFMKNFISIVCHSH